MRALVTSSSILAEMDDDLLTNQSRVFSTFERKLRTHLLFAFTVYATPSVNLKFNCENFPLSLRVFVVPVTSVYSSLVSISFIVPSSFRYPENTF